MAGTLPIEEFILLAYEALGGKIRGKTNLQKKLYFLGIKLGSRGLIEFDKLGYDAHYYGPYSSVVDSTNIEFTVLGLLDESIQYTGKYDDKGFEYRRYDYGLSDRGHRIADSAKIKFSDAWNIMKTVGEEIEKSGLDYMALSVAAKAYYILDKAGEATYANICEKAKTFHWQVDEASIENGCSFLEKLDLVETR